ncbi:hypothetical protein [Lysinibacillus xylanilyticus]|uniref:hypothetical protein n=1 Tax=Lysinibacillus xylanilyticus TaxID=582475 RepID=UPI003D07CA42
MIKELQILTSSSNVLVAKAKRQLQVFFCNESETAVTSVLVAKAQRQLQVFFVTKAK